MAVGFPAVAAAVVVVEAGSAAGCTSHQAALLRQAPRLFNRHDLHYLVAIPRIAFPGQKLAVFTAKHIDKHARKNL